MRKTRAIKFKIQEKHMTTLMFSHEFKLERELCNASVLSLTRELKQNLNICRQAKEEIKGIDIWYINRNIVQ